MSLEIRWPNGSGEPTPRYIAQKERAGIVFISPESGVQMSPRLCLVTDDSPTVRKVARRLLQTLGFEVDEAENGRIALEKCECRMPDVILLDWNMPIMNGIEFLRLLRRTRNGKAPAVILCTTESDVDHIHEAIQAGADEYLIKPFDANTLGAKLKAVAACQPV